jgi:hypothetical protein
LACSPQLALGFLLHCFKSCGNVFAVIQFSMFGASLHLS